MAIDRLPQSLQRNAEVFTKEIQSNINAYDEIKDESEQTYFCKTALLHNGKLDTIYNDQNDAYHTDRARFGIGHFAITTDDGLYLAKETNKDVDNSTNLV